MSRFDRTELTAIVLGTVIITSLGISLVVISRPPQTRCDARTCVDGLPWATVDVKTCSDSGTR